MSDLVHFVQCVPESLRTRPDAFEYCMQLTGKSYRKVAGRETLKVRLGEGSYFIKKHFGVGWLEVFKNWLVCKRPVVSASNEVQAIHALQAMGIPTTPYVGYGVRGSSPASVRSFVLTEDLGDIVTLEDLALRWQKQAPSLRQKRALIRRVAEIAGLMHAHGIYHRDFYICHFCFQPEDQAWPPMLHVLDLHRAEIHKKPVAHMQLKDLAALYFSAMDVPLSRGDVRAFLRSYTQVEPAVLQQTDKFYKALTQRALKLYAKYQRKQRAGIEM